MNTGTIDRSAALHNVGGDPEILRTLFQMFLEQGPARLGQIEAALATGDVGTLEREAHSLKGAAAILGMERLRGLASSVERAGAAGDLARAAPNMTELRAALDDVLRALREELTPP